MDEHSVQAQRCCYEFGDFRLDPRERLLWRANEVVPLTAKVFDLLLLFVEHGGRMLDKETMMQRIWPDSAVEEGNLTRNVSTLRRALGEGPNEHRYIVTIPGRGYRFVAEVRKTLPEEAEVIIEEESRAHVVVEKELETAEPIAQPKIVTALPFPNTRPSRRAAPMLLTTVALLVLILGGYWRARRSPQRVEAAPIKTMAVLPFKSLNSPDEYLGLGMADVLITRLSNLQQLAVRPTTAVLRFASGTPDPVEAGRQMQVDSVLDGSIQQIGERVRVTVRLVRVSDGQPLWSYKCDEACSDVFAVQDAISEKVTQALSLKLTGGERERLNRRYTANAEAYQEYLKGRYFTLQFSPEGYQKARAHLQRAIELDPNYALAYAGLADAHTTASEEMLPPREVMPQAIAAARHALALDDTLAEAHAALGHALFHTWHYAEAEPELRRALELNPNATATYIWYGEFFAHTDPPRGVELLKRAEQLEPLSAIVYGFRAYVALMAGQTELALAEGRKALELAPASIAPWFVQSLVMAGGHDAEAESMLREALAKEREPGGLLLLAIIEARKGRSEEAVQLIEEAKRASGGRYFSPYHFAAAYAALGQKDEAFACLEKAYADQSEYIGTLKYDPLMRGLRGDARLTAMVRRIGLAP